ncbi:MAG: DNA circularization N-terminal domain-containing protein [Thermoplasmatales archaeon]|nr:MAG: DNA circularization N-terminal domain-containing protein [Thermoplasmatales archaeon]
MGTFNQLFKASFRGVRFLPKGDHITVGGRKLIKHVYPNTDRRFIEDLGKMQKDFSITGVITGPNYFAKKRALINALDKEGPGTLVHPFFGKLQVVAEPYTINESLQSINEATFEMSFSIPTKNIFPSSQGLFKFPSLSLDISSAIIDRFQEWSTAFADTILEAENSLNQVYDKFDDVSRLAASVTDNISSFKRLISDARSAVSSAIRAPSLIAGYFNDLFSSLNELIENPRDKVNLLAEFYGFTAGNQSLRPTTKVRESQIDNDTIINQTINVGALSNAYLNASDIDFESDEDLLNISQNLESQFSSIIEDLPDELYKRTYAIREEYRKFADNRLVSINKVQTVTARKESLTPFVYKYYGTLDNYETIMKLNSILNTSEIDGIKKIISG